MGVQDTLQEWNNSINEFFRFVSGKLADFKNLSLGEQISYCCVGAGFLMVIASVVLFVI